jgi:hypothetical protein
MTKRLASTPRPLFFRAMKRLALSLATAVAALGLGACEQHASDKLPEHYREKGSHRGKSEAAPAHSEHEKAPAGEHKS